jgi:hypothetical protein
MVGVLVFEGVVGGACTKKNPDLCCTDQASCDAMGISIDSKCADGLICRGNQCIAETCTTSENCEAGAPFCVSELCAATCTSDAQCPGFGGAPPDVYCDSGTCIECRNSADCSDPQRPVCDAHVCAGCVADAECSSSLCTAEGACLDAAAILYVDSAGFDGGDCGQSAPCKSVTFAATRGTSTRNTISIAAGTYSENVVLDTATTGAAGFEIYGHGATILAPSTAQFSTVTVKANFSNVTLADLTIIPQALQRGGVGAAAPLTLRNVAIQGGQIALSSDAGLTATNVTLTNTGGATIQGQLKADGLSLLSANMTTGFFIASGTVVDITNLVIAGSTSECLTISDLATGTISNATIADCGTVLTAGPAAIKCGTGTSVSIRSSIVWTPDSTLPALSGCNFSQTMLGPTPVTGASSADPLFVNYGMHDFRLRSTSPAVDAASAGPAVDVQGTARPQGVRYDLGAYEFKP